MIPMCNYSNQKNALESHSLSTTPAVATRSNTTTAISTVTGTEVQILIAKLNRVFPYLPFPNYTTNHEDVDILLPLLDLSCYSHANKHNKVNENNKDTDKDTTNCRRPPKHILQCESMYRHLDMAGLCKPGMTYCEVGCGTAKLSDFISAELHGLSSHLLIDRKAFDGRNAVRIRDRAIAARCHHDCSVKRLVRDLAEVNCLETTVVASGLCCSESEQQQRQLTSDNDDDNDDEKCRYTRSKNIVAISKHLCGPATDYLIRSLEAVPTIPIAVATCCHYLCKPDIFSNMKFFKDIGFTDRDFEVLTIVSQWASIRGRKQKQDQKQSENNESFGISKSDSVKEKSNEGWLRFTPLPQLSPEIEVKTMVPSNEFENKFSRNQKLKLGQKCKLLLDTARAYSLNRLGYKVKLVLYTELSVEDHMLFAIPDAQAQQ